MLLSTISPLKLRLVRVPGDVSGAIGAFLVMQKAQPQDLEMGARLGFAVDMMDAAGCERPQVQSANNTS